MADRAGRLEDDVLKIKLSVLPGDEANIDTMLEQLKNGAFILRYIAKGNRYIQIINFHKHQYPHIKEKNSTIPAPYRHGDRTIPARLNPDSGLLNPESVLAASPQPYPLPEPKTNPKACLVLSFKARKGVPYDNRDWDKANFPRAMKSAGVLLGLCGDLAVAQTCLDALGTEYDEKGLTWTLETVARNAAEWLKRNGRIDANASRAGLRLAIANRRAKDGDGKGLEKVSEGQILDGLRVVENSENPSAVKD